MEKIIEILNEAGLDEEKSGALASKISETITQDITDKAKEQECQNIINEYGDGGEGSPLNAIREWGAQNLPETLYNHLSESLHGIKAIETMMTNNANVSDEPFEDEKPLTHDELADMISKPEYWEPSGKSGLVSVVSKGFRDIYNKQT